MARMRGVVMGWVFHEESPAARGCRRAIGRSGEEQQPFADLVGEFVGAVQDVGKHGVLCGLDKEDQRFVVGMDGADVNLAFFAVDGDGAGRTQLEFSDERGTQGKKGATDGCKAVRAVLGTVRMCCDFTPGVSAAKVSSARVQ